MNFNIRNILEKDAPDICRIYNHYILNDHSTFETEPLSVEEMTDRIRALLKEYEFRVLELEGRLVAYAYTGPYRERSAYHCSAQLSVYVDHGECGKGCGKRALQDLLRVIPQNKYTSLISIVALPNVASSELHRSLGFVERGVLKKAGRKFGNFYDTALWQLML